MKKYYLSPTLKEWMKKHNKRLIITEAGAEFIDCPPPIDWSAVITYTVIGITVLTYIGCQLWNQLQ